MIFNAGARTPNEGLAKSAQHDATAQRVKAPKSRHVIVARSRLNEVVGCPSTRTHSAQIQISTSGP